MEEKRQTVLLKLSDEWPAEVAQLVGLISIAFAQLQRVIYLAAKRKADTDLVEWEQATRNDNFDIWCQHLIREYQDDKELISLVELSQCAAERRHDLIHAEWGRDPDGALGRWRRGWNLGLELEPLKDLLVAVRQLRDDINRLTKDSGDRPHRRKGPAGGRRSQ
jgi:hypothetical protein